MANHYRRASPVVPPPLRPENDRAVPDWRTTGPAARVLALQAAAPVKRPAPPELESNLKPIHDLEALITLIGQRRVERELNVHRTTVARWRAGVVAIPGAQCLGIRALLGDLPGTAGKWHGWRFHDGLLLSPAGDAYAEGQVMTIGLQRQRIAQLERDLTTARDRITLLERGYPQAANEVPARGRRRASA